MRLSSKKIAAVVILSGVMFVALAGPAFALPPWSDATNAWWLSSYGVTDTQVATVADGYPDGTFKPANPVTRGQFAKMAVTGLDLATLDPIAPTFIDVARGSTYYIYVEGAHDEGLIGGYPTGSGLEFRPNNNISRQQTNSILGRYLSQAELDATGVIHGTGSLTYASLALWYAAQGGFYLNGFLDASQVAPVHRDTTAYLIYHGIVEGSAGKLNPSASLNRAQAAVMVLRVAQEARDITTPPPAPTGLVVTPENPGNDATPRVSGNAIPSSPIAVYDTFGGVTTKLIESSTNPAGEFSVGLTTPLVDGAHSFTAKVKNAAGLVSAASAAIPYVLDTVAPAGSITAPVVTAGGIEVAVNLAKPAFTASATDDRSGVKNVEFQVAEDKTTLVWQTISLDTAPDTGTSTYAAVWPTTGDLKDGLGDGQYKFRVVITDNAGNQKTVGPLDVTVDTKKPTVSITAPLPDTGTIYYTENHKPVFTADADDTAAAGVDASGIAKVEFFYVAWSASPPTAFADFTLLSADVSPAFGATYPTAGLANGHYVFAVRATDYAGNQSLLMDGTQYAAGVTQEVIVDDAAPVISITAPAGAALVPDDKDYTIHWTLADASPPEEVKIEYSATGDTPWTTIAAAAPNSGSYVWHVPPVGADSDTYRIRIAATDATGHTTTQPSAAFTVYKAPVGPALIEGDDPDDTVAGVNYLDFQATWTVSVSPHVVSQKVYLLPSAATLNLTTDPVDVPAATLANNTTAAWTPTAALTVDSRGGALAGGDYKIWIVVTDPAGRTASASSVAFTVKAEP